MENSLKSVIDSAKSVLVLLPKNPYFDQVASGLALYLSYKDEKEIYISCPTEMLVEFNRLVGVDKITQELGSKNLLVTFANYDARQIEKVSYDIEGQEFKLTVAPKTTAEPPSKDQVIASYTGGSADLTIFIGGANETHFPAATEESVVNSKKAHIGVHDLALSGLRDIVSFAEPAASTSEVVYKLLKNSGKAVNADIATNLLMGIQDGSKSFSHRNVNAGTFSAAAELMGLGARLAPKETERRISTLPTSGPGPTPLAPAPVGQPAQTQQNDQSSGGLQPPKSWLSTPKVYKGTSVS